MKSLVAIATLFFFCSVLTAQSPIVQVVALEEYFIAVHADGTMIEARADGEVIELGTLTIDAVRGTSFDYTLPEDKAYKVHQDCANMTLKTCIKRFREAIVELRIALGY